MEAIEIVPIRDDHIEGYHRALDFVSRERRYLAFLEAPPFESTQVFVRDNIKRGNLQFVAVSSGGDVVGWCDVVPLSRPTQAHRGVFGVGLLPQYRGRGIGTLLTQTAVEAARRFDLHRIELTVRESNTSAINIYKKAGFEVEGIQRHALLVDGTYEDVVSMALLL
jgi:ribosomal protein S18 acetylase RimI-like enzyme